MLVLDTINKTMTAVMSAVPATNQPNYVVAYADNNGTTFVEGANNGSLNGTSTVTIAPAPAASTRRIIKSIYIENTDTAPIVVTINYVNSIGATSVIAKVTLNPSDTWTTEGTYDSQGQIKYVVGTSGTTTYPLTIGTGLSGTSFNGSAAVTIANTGVLSVSGGTTGLTPNTATTGAVTLAGTLAVANGGTGQTTASAAFNALSPVTSTGDLIIGNGTNSATRLAIGTNGYVLTSNGTTATWSASGGSMVYPGAGIAVSTGSAWTTSLTAPSGTIVGTTDTQTLTNKRVTPRVSPLSSNSSTYAIDTDSFDIIVITSQTATITSITTTGTPTNGQKLWLSITGTAAVGFTLSTSNFEASTVALPTTTVSTNRLDIGFVWNVATGKWRCVAQA